MQKTVRLSGKGTNQLGEVIGMHKPGDTAFIHLKGWYVAPRTTCFGGKTKDRKDQFVSTHRIFDAAFFEVPITKSDGKPTTWCQCLELVLSTMKLGDDVTAKFTTFPKNEKDMVKGQWKRIPEDAAELILEIDSFRIVRDGKVHRRPDRNEHDTDGYRFAGMAM